MTGMLHVIRRLAITTVTCQLAGARTTAASMPPSPGFVDRG